MSFAPSRSDLGKIYCRIRTPVERYTNADTLVFFIWTFYEWYTNENALEHFVQTIHKRYSNMNALELIWTNEKEMELTTWSFVLYLVTNKSECWLSSLEKYSIPKHFRDWNSFVTLFGFSFLSTLERNIEEREFLKTTLVILLKKKSRFFLLYLGFYLQT